jgi:hypothetical protein
VLGEGFLLFEEKNVYIMLRDSIFDVVMSCVKLDISTYGLVVQS